MSAASYIRIWLASVVVILATVAALNLLIDPYDVSRFLKLPRLNAMKPAELGRARLRCGAKCWTRPAARNRNKGLGLSLSPGMLARVTIGGANGARRDKAATCLIHSCAANQGRRCFPLPASPS